MGYPSEKALQQLPNVVKDLGTSTKQASSAVSKLISKPIEHCEHCINAKFTSTISKKANTPTSEFLESVGSDVCGPFPIQALGGYRYFITLLDFTTRWLEVKLLRIKSDALAGFKDTKIFLKTSLN